MSQPAEVGIVSVGIHMPSSVMTAKEISAQSGLPEAVVREKLGINQKYIAGPEDHPNQMAVQAARNCLAKTNIKPEEIDLVICTTEEWREYLLWTAGINLAYELGATRAWAFDIHMRCATTIGALKIARDLMTADPNLRTVLIAGGYRICDFINLANLRTSFLFNIGAGAGAMLLQRDYPRNRIKGAHLITDGFMSNHVVVPASGTKRFPDDAAIKENLFKFDLVEPEAMKERLGQVSIPNWLKCIDAALAQGGYTRDDAGFLNMVLVKPSAHRELLDHLRLKWENSVYLSDYGHIGEQDTIICIEEGLKQGRLKDGDVMVMVGAGIGYVWGAAAVKWGPA